MKNSPDVLVFFSYKSHKRGYIEMLFERLQTAAKHRALNLYRGSLSDMNISIINDAMIITESMTNRDLASFGLIYFELWHKAPEMALAAALYARRHAVPFFSSEPERVVSLTKVGDMAKLSDNGLPLPNTFISSTAQIKKAFEDNAPLKYPLVVKAANGFGGKDNFLVRDYPALLALLDVRRSVRFIVQEFIPNNCDYRCLVLGNEVALVLRRTRDVSAQTHLNNTSQGGEGEIVPLSHLPAVARADAVKAAQLLHRGEFAGVDLIVDTETGRHYVLEVNQAPQIEIGAEVDQKKQALLAYMQVRAERGQQDD